METSSQVSKAPARFWGPNQVSRAYSQDLGLQPSHRSLKGLQLGIKDFQPGLRQLQLASGASSQKSALRPMAYRKASRAFTDFKNVQTIFFKRQ